MIFFLWSDQKSVQITGNNASFTTNIEFESKKHFKKWKEMISGSSHLQLKIVLKKFTF